LNSVADIWQLVLQRLQLELSETTINTWFDEVSAVEMKDKVFYLHCPNEFKRGMIESLFTAQIKAALREVFSAELDLRLLSTAERDAMLEPQAGKALSLFDSGDFTFETFVVGESNKMACAAARAVADGVGHHYNPLFIYGDSGLGKTHLIYAIANRFRSRNDKAKIVYVKGDDFINDFIELLRLGRSSEFRTKYRDADLLLVDDVQFVAGKQQVQNEFFNTFNTLYEAGRQIVLTSDRPPSEMTLLDDRLRTRFEWGLLADIQPPDFETRVAIVKNKAIQRGFVIDDELASYVAENVTANVRQLEGTVNKIIAFRELNEEQLDEQSAARAVREMILKSKEYIPTPDVIIAEVSRFYGVGADVIRGPSRSREAVNARQVAMFLVRRMTNLSTPSIGKAFGDRDHSTVMHSLDRVEEKIQTDSAFSQTVKDIMVNINSKK